MQRRAQQHGIARVTVGLSCTMTHTHTRTLTQCMHTHYLAGYQQHRSGRMPVRNGDRHARARVACDDVDRRAAVKQQCRALVVPALRVRAV
jgi:hypothetical protein